MKLLPVLLCAVLVVQVYGQGYMGRPGKPALPKSYLPKPMLPRKPYSGGLLPKWKRKLPKKPFSDGLLPKSHLPQPKLSKKPFSDGALPKSHLPKPKLPKKPFSGGLLPKSYLTKPKLPKKPFSGGWLPKSYLTKPKLPKKPFSGRWLPKSYLTKPKLPKKPFSGGVLPYPSLQKPKLPKKSFPDEVLPTSYSQKPMLPKKPFFDGVLPKKSSMIMDLWKRPTSYSQKPMLPKKPFSGYLGRPSKSALPKTYLPKPMLPKKPFSGRLFPKPYIPKPVLPKKPFPGRLFPKPYIPKPVLPKKPYYDGLLTNSYLPKKMLPKKSISGGLLPNLYIPPKPLLPKKPFSGGLLPKAYLPKPMLPKKQFSNELLPKAYLPKPMLPKKPFFDELLPMAYMPKPVLPKKPFSNSLLDLQGDGYERSDPPWIKKLLGSTVDGLPKIGGQAGFPRHGGAGTGQPFSNGLRSGLGRDSAESTHESVNSWNDPLSGRLFPTDYTGGELVLDSSSGHYIHKETKLTGAVGPIETISPVINPVGPVGHQVAKESHSVAKSAIEHNLMNEANHMVRKTVDGVSPLGLSGMGPGVEHHGMMKSTDHKTQKSMSNIDGAGNIGDIGGIKMNLGAANLLDLQGGHFGEDPPWIKKLLGSTLDGLPKIGGQGAFPRHGGAGIGQQFANGLRNGWGGDPAERQHESVNSWNDPLGGRLFPTDYTGGELVMDTPSGQYIHMAAKSAGAVGPVNGPVGPAGHQVAKESHSVAKSAIEHNLMNEASHMVRKTVDGVSPLDRSGMDPRDGMTPIGAVGPIEQIHKIGPIGGPKADLMVDPFDVHGSVGNIGSSISKVTSGVHKISNNPVSNVHEVAKSGMASAGHDPLALQLGTGIAKEAARQSSNAVDTLSNGGVSRGDPFALAAAKGLAMEVVHVAGKTLSIGNGKAETGVLDGRMYGYGGIPKTPVVPKHPVMPDKKGNSYGYGRSSG